MLRKLTTVAAAVISVLLVSQAAQADDGPKNLGMVGVKSVQGRYLQAHSDNGEMHASNEHRNTEETWFLIEVDRKNHVYALLNWDNHKFMSKSHRGCVPAISTTLGPTEKWVLVPGKPYGVDNAVAFRSFADGTYLGTLPAGQDDRYPDDKDHGCGGEVSARQKDAPPKNNSQWPGWWVLEPAATPEKGRDFWNTAGRVIEGIATELKPLAEGALMAALLAG